MRAATVFGLVAAVLLLAACGSASRTAQPGATAAVTGATTAATAAPPPTAFAAAPLDAGIYRSVNAAAAELLAAPTGIDDAAARCATSGDCTEVQAIASRVRAAETTLSVLLLSAGAGVQRGTGCRQAITDLSDAVVHRFRGRLDDLFERTGADNAQRLSEALAGVGRVAEQFKAACAPPGV
jgi:hypothetical protein